MRARKLLLSPLSANTPIIAACSAERAWGCDSRLLERVYFPNAHKADAYRTPGEEDWWIALVYRRDYVNSLSSLVYWQRACPIREVASVTNVSLGQWRRRVSGKRRDVPFHDSDATLQDFYHVFFSIRPPHRCLPNTQGSPQRTPPSEQNDSSSSHIIIAFTFPVDGEGVEWVVWIADLKRLNNENYSVLGHRNYYCMAL